MTPIQVIQAIQLAFTAGSKGMKAVNTLKYLAKVNQLINKVRDTVLLAMKDGALSVDEAEELAADELADVDLKLKVDGQDVLDPKAQNYLVRGAARVFARSLAAKVK